MTAAEDFLAYMADHGQAHRAFIRVCRARDAMVADTLAAYEN